MYFLFVHLFYFNDCCHDTITSKPMREEMHENTQRTESSRLNVRLYETPPLVRSKVEHGDTFRSRGNSPNSKGASDQNISLQSTNDQSINWLHQHTTWCMFYFLNHSSESVSLFSLSESLSCFTSCISFQFKAVYSWRLLLWSSHRKWVVSQTSKLLF